MPDSVIYVSFKDTVSTKNPDALKFVIANLASQIIDAAKRIEEDENAIYDYVRQDSALPVEQPKTEISITPKPQNKPEPKANVEKEMVDLALTKFKRVRPETRRTLAYLSQNSGQQLSLSDIAQGSGRTVGSIEQWLRGPAKDCKAITSPAQGVYVFNPNKL